MYTHILVPVVFEHGDRAEAAIKIAMQLLETSGKITLLHVMEDIPAYANNFLPEGLHEKHVTEAASELQDMAGTISAETEAKVIHGHASSGILDYAKTHDVDCVIIASHKPGIEDYFLGSTAARVVRHAQCGVHVLR